MIMNRALAKTAGAFLCSKIKKSDSDQGEKADEKKDIRRVDGCSVL
jgi:hypothetical protein